ncbi:MAG: response regulator [Sulfurimonas sp.]|nr:response regulator [Sulfurimonas sp.]
MIDNSEFKILIIDDEIFNIEVIIGFLEEENYNLFYSTHPREALQKIYEENFDLILLDINMPDINGIEVCRRIKNDDASKNIPVIFLSAFSDTKTITDSFEAGGVDYITKPFNGLELIARVKTHIELRKYIKELQIKQEKLAQIVATDTQTGLPNRLRFISIIKKETSKIKSDPSRLSLGYIKIDNLQKINALYGYKNGDKVITKIAQIFKKNIKENYTIARIFGSELVILMPDTSLEAAGSLVKKLLNLVRKTKFVSIKMSCSIGVGEYNLNEEYEPFMHRVEKLMKDIDNDGGDMISGIIA